MDPTDKKLRDMVKKSEPFRKICDYLASWEAVEAGHESPVQEVADDAQVERGQVIKLFQWLGKHDYGQFILGRRGLPTRFRWEWQPNSVGQCALGHVDECRPVGESSDEGLEHPGQEVWTFNELCDLAAQASGIEAESIRIDLKIGEAKRLLAAALGVEVAEVSIRIG